LRLSSAIRLSAVGLALALFTLLSAARVSAQSTQAESVATARSLASAGVKAYQEGKLDLAADLLSRAEALHHAPTHILFLARTLEKKGRLVEAQETYNRLIRERLSNNAPDAFIEAQNVARDEQQALAGRVATLTVRLSTTADDSAHVRLSGKEIPTAMVGVPRPIDPGSYEVSLDSELYAARPITIRLGEGQKATVTLELTPKSPDVLGESRPTESSRAGRKAFGYSALGAGLIGTGIGAGFLVSHISHQTKAKNAFDDGGCDQNGACTPDQKEDILEHSRKGANSGNVAIIGFSAGVVGLTTGLILLLTNKSATPQAPGQHARKRSWIRPGVGFGTVFAEGHF
jgi:tetratricopeptide (TPR) repeat protein